MAMATKLVFGMARRLVRTRRAAKESDSKCSELEYELEKTESERDESERTCDRLRKDISGLELKVQGLQGESEILRTQIVSLTMVVKRDQERVAAETAMYMIAAQGSEPVKHVGASVATRVTPGL